MGTVESFVRDKEPHLRLLIFNAILYVFIFALVWGQFFIEIVPGPAIPPGVYYLNVIIMGIIFFVIGILSLVIYVPIYAILWGVSGSTLSSLRVGIILLTIALTSVWFGFLTRQARFTQVGAILVIAQFFLPAAFGVLNVQIGVEHPSPDAGYWELLGRVAGIITIGNFVIDIILFLFYFL